MVKVCALMPVHIRVPALVDATLQAVASLVSEHEDLHLRVLINQQTVMPPGAFAQAVALAWPGAPNHLTFQDDGERCVAGTWNAGIRWFRAHESDLDYLFLVNNDAVLEPDCLDTLIGYAGQRPADVWVWSATNTRDHPLAPLDSAATTVGADFSAFMVAADWPDRFGWFDENFVPAYYEDNDTVARVVLAGGACRQVQQARYFHEGSQTIRQDPQASKRNAITFARNHRYLSAKWGIADPLEDPDQIRLRYAARPFNDHTKPLSWWPDVPPERAADFW